MTPERAEKELRDAIDSDDWEAVDMLAPILDAQDAEHRRRRDAVTLIGAALFYASLGLRVFPLRPRAKVPFAGSGGCLDATTDPGQIERWWANQSAANVGIATGCLVDVIDVDGPRGVKSWANLANLPPILGRVSTPRPGGNHLYVTATGRGNRAGIADGVDYRGGGGYVVAPPSVTDVGTYLWVTALTLPVAEVVA